MQNIVKYRGEDAWCIPSASDPSKRYKVTLHSCDCKGFQYRGQCKHIEELIELIAGEPEESLTELLEKSIEMTKKDA